MRGLFQRTLVLCLLLFLPSCQSGDLDPLWTILVYMDGDNNLSAAANQDLIEMEAVGSDSPVQVVVQLDTIDGTTKRLTVQKGKVTVIEDLGELNMANPRTLTDFLTWAGNNYPAQHRALILWDHGSGYLDSGVKASRESTRHAKGILQDDTNGTPCCLSNRIVRDAILAAGMHFDLLGFDASEMGEIETAYEFRNAADILVFSQETGQENGWDYTAILSGLERHPGMTSEDLAQLIVEAYRNFYENIFYPANPDFEQHLTVSAIRLGSAFESFVVKINNLALQLKAAINHGSTRDATVAAVGSARDAAQGMVLQTAPDVYADFLDWVDKLLSQPGLDPSIRTALTNLQAAKDSVVISEYHGRARPGATGLSIVFFKLPEAQNVGTFDADYVGGAEDLDLINDTNWNEFLSVYYSAAGLL
ncbi:MAG TPA: clostripain-related cysteine peptidase [Nitrospiria bacterium]|nr:clostripain-related cysteine peptidase [Nitrospiria bacterium]